MFNEIEKAGYTDVSKLMFKRDPERERRVNQNEALKRIPLLLAEALELISDIKRRAAVLESLSRISLFLESKLGQDALEEWKKSASLPYYIAAKVDDERVRHSMRNLISSAKKMRKAMERKSKIERKERMTLRSTKSWEKNDEIVSRTKAEFPDYETEFIHAVLNLELSMGGVF